MKYSIDRLENDIVILEDIESGEKKEVSIENLPPDIKEGTILKYTNNQYELDLDEEVERRKRIMEKFNRLKK